VLDAIACFVPHQDYLLVGDGTDGERLVELYPSWMKEEDWDSDIWKAYVDGKMTWQDKWTKKFGQAPSAVWEQDHGNECESDQG
jgi:hypothetical protein